ncbi:MAG: N-acyl-D-amino-acid deacylase family protein, partial [Sphaerochaetaceae bacterium]
MNRYHFRNAEIIDGNDTPPLRGDVLVEGEDIKAILPAGSSRKGDFLIRDCSSLVLCPGFIDLHGHSDLEVLRHPLMQSKIAQGITTEVAGNCGIGVFPAAKGSPFLQELCSDVLGLFPSMGWRDFTAYKQEWSVLGSGTNMVFLQAHSTLRKASMQGDVNRPATEKEITKMCALLSESLEAGCWGMSTGLYYAPCTFAEEKELLSLLEVLSRHNALFAVHMRCEGTEILSSLKEVFALAQRTGVRLQISHLKVIGRKNQHLVDTVLSLIDQERMNGMDVQFDQYPYTYGSTSLFSLLPPAYLRLERKALQKVLADDEQRQTIKKQMENPTDWDSLASLCGWDQIRILSMENNRAYEMMSLTEIGQERGSSPWDAFFDLLQAEQGVALMMDVTQSEESLKKILRHSLMCFGTDALYAGPLCHPRSYQATIHLLHTYWKQEAVLPLQSLINRMSAKPAQRLGLLNRGKIAAGFKADLV